MASLQKHAHTHTVLRLCTSSTPSATMRSFSILFLRCRHFVAKYRGSLWHAHSPILPFCYTQSISAAVRETVARTSSAPIDSFFSLPFFLYRAGVGTVMSLNRIRRLTGSEKTLPSPPPSDAVPLADLESAAAAAPAHGAELCAPGVELGQEDKQ